MRAVDFVRSAPFRAAVRKAEAVLGFKVEDGCILCRWARVAVALVELTQRDRYHGPVFVAGDRLAGIVNGAAFDPPRLLGEVKAEIRHAIEGGADAETFADVDCLGGRERGGRNAGSDPVDGITAKQLAEAVAAVLRRLSGDPSVEVEIRQVDLSAGDDDDDERPAPTPFLGLALPFPPRRKRRGPFDS